MAAHGDDEFFDVCANVIDEARAPGQAEEFFDACSNVIDEALEGANKREGQSGLFWLISLS